MQKSYLRERFRNTLSPDTQNSLRSFCEVLWNCDSDYFIFMARKAACLFDCLKEMKIADVRGRALNDRVLDMDLAWIKDKTVTLVDDCVFSGTTLYRAARAINGTGCKRFETVAMAVNRDTLRAQLLPGGSEWEKLRIADPVLRASDSACVRQCFDIVRALSLVPRPYDVDFPQTVPAKLRDSELRSLLEHGAWRAFDVSSNLQRSSGVAAFTIIPTMPELQRFAAWHGGSTSMISCAKIRVYARRLQGGSHSVRLVPIVVLPAIENSDVLSALVVGRGGTHQLLEGMGATSPSSRYRLLHYLVSHCLLDWFVQYHAAMQGQEERFRIRSDLMEMSFGDGAWNRYSTMWSDRGDMRLARETTVELGNTARHMPNGVVQIRSATDFMKEMSRPFEWLYAEKEGDVRKQVREHGLDYEGPNDGRLLEGFTYDVLCRRIGNPEIETSVIASVALDRMVDLGITVPTIFESHTACARTFRHGEDAIIGPAQERMLLIGLQAYMKNANRDSISGLELQKVIVLLIQAAIRNGDIESYSVDAEFPPGAYVVGVKGFLHGNIPVVMSEADARFGNYPFIPGCRAHPQWLVDHWIRDGFLKRRGHSTISSQCYVDSLPEHSAGARAEAQLRLYAKGLGTAMRAGLLGGDKELVILSSCAEPDHQLRSLSGELVYFRDNWSKVLREVQALVAKGEFGAARKTLRSGKIGDHFYAAFVAINSGARKYDYYINGAFRSCVDGTYEKLAKLESESGAEWHGAADCWAMLWPDTDPAQATATTSAGELLHRAGRWLRALNVALRIFDLGLVLRAVNVSQLSKGEAAKSTRDLEARVAEALESFTAVKDKPRFFQFLKNAHMKLQRNDLSGAIEWESEAENLIADWVAKSTPMLEDIRCICSAYGDVSEVRHYAYVVFIETNAFTAGHPDQAQIIALDVLRRFELERCICLNEAHNPWPGTYCVAIEGSRKDCTAVEYCGELARELSYLGVPFRLTVIGSLAHADSVRRFAGSRELAVEAFKKCMQDVKGVLPQKDYRGEIRFVTIKGPKAVLTEASKYRALNAAAKIADLGEFEIGDTASTKRKVILHRTQSGCQSRPLRVLFCTATDAEDDAVAKAFAAIGVPLVPKSGKHVIYQRAGRHGSADVYWVRSGIGSTGSDGAALTAQDAIDEIDPVHVISVGIAFGADERKQRLGDVLVSTKILPYEKGKMQPTSFEPRGTPKSADAHLLQAARIVRLGFESPAVHFGAVLSGEKIVNRLAFKNHLLKTHPGAVGGEMEGAGISDAADRRRRGFILVKGICDWGEGKSDSSQDIAATNALRFVLEMLTRDLVVAGG